MIPRRVLAAAFLVCLALSATEARDDRSPGAYEMLFDSLTHLQPSAAQGAPVSRLVLRRDAATFTLDDGTLYACEPLIGGRMRAAFFVGEGRFTFMPPTDVEKEQLYRFYEKRSLDEPITKLFLLFTDSTFDELSRLLKFRAVPLLPGLTGDVAEALKYVSEEDGKYFMTGLMKSFLEGGVPGVFFAHVALRGESDPLMVKIDPSDDEEVSLLKRARSLRWHRYPEVVNQFHKATDYARDPRGVTEGKRSYDVIRYDLRCDISGGLDYSARATLTYRVEAPGQRWLVSTLYDELEVDSVLSGAERLEFYKGDKNPFAWIRFPSPRALGDTGSVTLYYHGDLLSREPDGYIEFRAPGGWYPRVGSRDKAEFLIEYHTPASLTLVSTGEKVSESTAGDVVTSRWRSPKPMRNASFNIGYFKTPEIKGETVRPVTLYVTEHGDLEDNVADDLVNSVKFFDRVFGPAPMQNLVASEIPYTHGEAFPGLIHLSYATFKHADIDGFNHVFRGHEVAHQWWGIGVDFRTYHDQWLSEGFADYAGLMYLQAAYRNNGLFFDMLREWKQNILSNRKFLFGSGQESGPVSLGYRTESSQSRGDYNLVIYQKGAWILHMLRNMLVDLQSMKEEKFNAMMKEFYSSYLDESATTEDFRTVVERYVDGDMGWFFTQWVDGTAVPKYVVSHREEARPDGKYVVHFRIRQENVPEKFRMIVPVRVDFGDGRYARLRILAEGPLSEFDLPPLPLPAKDITFNDLESVLCEVEYEDYK